MKHSARALPIPEGIPYGHDWCRCLCATCSVERSFYSASFFELPPIVVELADLPGAFDDQE